MKFISTTASGRERTDKQELLDGSNVSTYSTSREAVLMLKTSAGNVYLTGNDIEMLFNRYHKFRIMIEHMKITGIDAIREYESAKRECFAVINEIVGEKVLKL